MANFKKIKPHYLLGVLLIFFFIVSLVVALVSVQKSKETRQSEAAATATLSITPQTSVLSQNQNQQYKIMLNSSVQNEKIFFVRVDVEFDKNALNLVSITPSENFVIPQKTSGESLVSTPAEANSSGKFYAVFVVPSDKFSSAPSGNFEVASFTLRGIASINSSSLSFVTNSMQVVSLNTDPSQRNLIISPQNASVTVVSGVLISPSPDVRADINSDGIVNLLDYIILLENFGKRFN